MASKVVQSLEEADCRLTSHLSAVTGSSAIVYCEVSPTVDSEERNSHHNTKSEVFIAQSEHLWMPWDPSDHSCKNRKKRRDVLQGNSPSEDLGTCHLLFSYYKLSD